MKYFFKPEAAVTQLEVIKTETGAKRAYLTANDTVDRGALLRVRESLAQQGLLTTPVEYEGHAVLEVRKFASENALLAALKKAGINTDIASTAQEKTGKIGPWQWIKNNTYSASLGFYIFGDIGYMLYGRFKEKFDTAKDGIINSRRKRDGLTEHPESPSNPYDKYAGWAYAAGTASSIAATALRGDQSDEEVEAISTDIISKIKEKGGEKTSVTYHAVSNTKAKTFSQKLKGIFIKYPSEILNSAYAMAGLLMIVASHGHLKHANKSLNAAKDDFIGNADKLDDIVRQLKNHNMQGLDALQQEFKTIGKSFEATKNTVSINSSTKTAIKNVLASTEKILETHGSNAGAKNALSDLRKIASPLEDFIASNKKLRVAKQDIALGSITLGSGTLATVVKEQAKTADEEEPKGIVDKTIRWFKEKPLRIAGIGYMVSTAIHLWSTIGDYSRMSGTAKIANRILGNKSSSVHQLADANKDLALVRQERKFVHGRMTFVVTNLIAEILLALSSKGHGDGVLSDETVKQSALSIAAENIALQDKSKQATLTQEVATHLASPKIMGGNAYLIEKGLKERVDKLQSNPWTDTGMDTAMAPAR